MEIFFIAVVQPNAKIQTAAFQFCSVKKSKQVNQQKYSPKP